MIKKMIFAIVLFMGSVGAAEKKLTVEDLRPGLGEIMSVIQGHHAKLSYAGEASNWELADYELDEIKEGLESAEKFYPHFKSVKQPLTELIPALTGKEIDAVFKAIKTRDHGAFIKGFEALTTSCNKCHQMAEHGFIVVQVPSTPAYPNQKFTK